MGYITQASKDCMCDDKQTMQNCMWKIAYDVTGNLQGQAPILQMESTISKDQLSRAQAGMPAANVTMADPSRSLMVHNTLQPPTV